MAVQMDGRERWFAVEQKIDHPLLPSLRGRWMRARRYVTREEAEAAAESERATASPAESWRVVDLRETQRDLFEGADLPCGKRCQYAVDVSMPEHSCATECQYAAPPDQRSS